MMPQSRRPPHTPTPGIRSTLSVTNLVTGFNPRALVAAERRRLRMTAAAAVPAPPEPPPGVFTPDNEWVIPLEVDILAEEYPSEFWSQWEKTELKLSMEPWISPDKLRETAKEIGFPNLDYVEEMAVMLEEGARTGVEGAARLPSSGPNNPNLRNVAPQVLDTLRTWCRQGLVCGPLEDSEVPAGAKSSPLSGVLKPSGKARIINNQSWPHLDNPDLEGDEAVSFNAGIQSDLFPTIQITSKHLLKRLTEVGEGAYASKVDMSDAYKVSLQQTEAYSLRTE